MSNDKPEKNGNGKVTGKVLAAPGAEKITTQKGDTFEKRLIVVECEDGKFTRKIAVTFFGKNAEKAEGVRVGDEVTAYYSAKSRDYKDRNGEVRWSTDLDGWRCEMVRQAGGYAPPAEPNGGGWGGAPPGDDDQIPF